MSGDKLYDVLQIAGLVLAVGIGWAWRGVWEAHKHRQRPEMPPDVPEDHAVIAGHLVPIWQGEAFQRWAEGERSGQGLA